MFNLMKTPTRSGSCKTVTSKLQEKIVRRNLQRGTHERGVRDDGEV
jgi:hypothetical protein